MKEFYRDEKPAEAPITVIFDGGGGSGGGGGGGGGWWDGGGWGWGLGGCWWEGYSSSDPAPPEWQKPEKPGPEKDLLALRTDAAGRLMVDRTGFLIACQQLCPVTPTVRIYLRGENCEEHTECCQCNLVYTQLHPLVNYPDRTLTYDLWPRDFSGEREDKPAYLGVFPAPDPGEKLAVSVKWQSGHHDIGKVSDMRIVLYGVDLGWHTVSRATWRTVAVVTVDEWRHIKVNGLAGKLV